MEEKKKAPLPTTPKKPPLPLSDTALVSAFTPTLPSIKEPLPSFPSKVLRYIYESDNAQYQDQEVSMVDSFRHWLETQYLSPNPELAWKADHTYTSSYLMRHLYANGESFADTAESLVEAFKLNLAIMKNPKELTTDIDFILNYGAIYFYGRDKGFRPI
jgi:hypothetical protein